MYVFMQYIHSYTCDCSHSHTCQSRTEYIHTYIHTHTHTHRVSSTFSCWLPSLGYAVMQNTAPEYVCMYACMYMYMCMYVRPHLLKHFQLLVAHTQLSSNLEQTSSHCMSMHDHIYRDYTVTIQSLYSHYTVTVQSLYSHYMLPLVANSNANAKKTFEVCEQTVKVCCRLGRDSLLAGHVHVYTCMTIYIYICRTLVCMHTLTS